MSALTSIRAADLPLVIASMKLRRFNGGRTCQLCALSEAPTIEVNCRDSRGARQRAQAEALRWGISPARVSPMRRGDIGRLIERVQREHGRREVLRTWGSGIRALQQEPLHVLNGGSAA